MENGCLGRAGAADVLPPGQEFEPHQARADQEWAASERWEIRRSAAKSNSPSTRQKSSTSHLERSNKRLLPSSKTSSSRTTRPTCGCPTDRTYPEPERCGLPARAPSFDRGQGLAAMCAEPIPNAVALRSSGSTLPARCSPASRIRPLRHRAACRDRQEWTGPRFAARRTTAVSAHILTAAVDTAQHLALRAGYLVEVQRLEEATARQAARASMRSSLKAVAGSCSDRFTTLGPVSAWSVLDWNSR